MRLTHTTIYVLDQDEALRFYRDALGFEVHEDATMGDFRWLTVAHPDQPQQRLILMKPGPPAMDADAARQVEELLAKGVLGPGLFEVDDCARAYEQLSERGVNFLTEPAKRPYGIEATLRDNSGNWFSMTQRASG